MNRQKRNIIFIFLISISIFIGLVIYFKKDRINDNLGKIESPVNSIIVLNDTYYKDQGNVYCKGSILEGVDYDTFQVMSYKYAKDKDNIYKNCLLSLFSDDSHFKVLNKIDLFSFEVLNSVYFKDKNIVIFQDRQGGGIDIREINGANPESFEVINEKYSKDKNYVYFEFERSDISNYSTLEVNLENDIYGNYAKDKHDIYYEGQKITGSDLVTFEVISCQLVTGCFAKDKNNIYFEGNILEQADIQTFEIMFPDKPEYEKDKNFIWHRGELIENIK
jgi:DKNYY family